MKDNKLNYEIATGLNKKGNPVILLSPEMYDMMIQECRDLMIEFKSKNKRISKENFLKDFKYPALGVLATHPKVKEMIKNG